MTILREQDIRPEALMRDKQAAIDADRAFLLDRRDQWRPAPCPACDADDPIPFGEKNGFAYDRCARCATVYTNPRPTETLLAEFYAQSENYRLWNEVVFPATEDARRERIFAPRAERLSRILDDASVARDAAIDVGAAFGTFAAELRERAGFRRVVALEPTPALAQTCRDRGFETIESPLETLTPAPEFDLVTAFEVIEHVHSPRRFIESCRNLLNPAGALALSCPSAAGIETRLLGARASCFDHEHLNYFTPESLAALVRRCGLEIIEIQTPGQLDVDLIARAAREERLDLTNEPFLRRILLEASDAERGEFQRFLAGRLLSSHLWLVARLPETHA
jgi:2-polyprenyl-3-methyl-5-hydroxy-6-metoxy-1,4-benzoquinol methylase